MMQFCHIEMLGITDHTNYPCENHTVKKVSVSFGPFQNCPHNTLSLVFK